MPKGDLWLLLPNWSNSIFFTFSSRVNWLTNPGMIFWPMFSDTCVHTHTHKDWHIVGTSVFTLKGEVTVHMDVHSIQKRSTCHAKRSHATPLLKSVNQICQHYNVSSITRLAQVAMFSAL